MRVVVVMPALNEAESSPMVLAQLDGVEVIVVDNGSSDGTPDVARAHGATVVEKHFTDDNSRVGPDHGFAMNPASWREMVERSRELEAALGDGVKRVEANEQQTAVLQQRCLRLKHALPAGSVIAADDLEATRRACARFCWT